MNTLTSGLLVAALMLSACGATEPGTMPTDIPSDDVMLTVTDEGGFAPVELILGRHPRFVLQADGRLYTPGVVPAIYPGPMLTPIFVGTVDEATLAEIMRLVAATGLPEIDRAEDTTASNQVADATTTVITYSDGDTEHTLSVYALGIASDESQTAQAAADLVRALDAAAGALTEVIEYQPTKVEIRTSDRMALPDAEFRNTKPWPLAIAPAELAETAHGWKCVVVEGPPATDLLEVFADANSATVWEYEGTEHALIARGLTPAEPGCR